MSKLLHVGYQACKTQTAPQFRPVILCRTLAAVWGSVVFMRKQGVYSSNSTRVELRAKSKPILTHVKLAAPSYNRFAGTMALTFKPGPQGVHALLHCWHYGVALHASRPQIHCHNLQKGADNMLPRVTSWQLPVSKHRGNGEVNTSRGGDCLH